MTYMQTIEFLYGQLPMFTRIGKAAYKADLENTIALCKHLGDPQQNLQCIHIAGTNGKGSVSHMLSSLCQSMGLKTGLYTSPHLRDFRERIKINGEMIPENTVVGFVNRNRSFIEALKPSFFELTVGLCFEYFAEERVDIAIIETGLGGRLDSTNIIDPLLSVITNIGYDHMDLLGNTLEAIATEKAGIIKHKKPVVVGETQLETGVIFLEKANATGSRLTFADQVYAARNTSYTSTFMECDIFRNDSLAYEKLRCDLPGIYQQKNICTFLAAVDELNLQGFTVDEKVIRHALSTVKKQSGLMGRWQVLSEKPLTICDTGHNREGIKLVVQQLLTLPFKKLHIVFGMVSDKEPEPVLQLLPEKAVYYFCRAAIPRAMDEEELEKRAALFGLLGNSYSTVKEAFQAAQKNAGPNDVIFIGGSTFVVAEVI